MRFFKTFRITGVANSIIYDDGLTSTPSEKKKLVNVHVQMDGYAATDDNDFQGWLERTKVFEFPEKLLPSLVSTATVQAIAAPAYMTIPVDLDIPEGETFKAALSCAATLKKCRGVYEYEISS